MFLLKKKYLNSNLGSQKDVTRCKPTRQLGLTHEPYDSGSYRMLSAFEYGLSYRVGFPMFYRTCILFFYENSRKGYCLCHAGCGGRSYRTLSNTVGRLFGEYLDPGKPHRSLASQVPVSMSCSIHVAIPESSAPLYEPRCRSDVSNPLAARRCVSRRAADRLVPSRLPLRPSPRVSP